MKEIILVGANWCGSCKLMKEWFFSVELPGIILNYRDVEEIAVKITSVPVILFKENDEIIQELVGAISKADLIKNAKSIFEE